MIYLDHAATSFPKPESVYRAMDEVARNSLGNPGRAGHRLSRDAERVVNRCRSLLNQFLAGEGAERFIFTLNGTDSLNLAIKGILQPGDHVVSGVLEHNSVLRPLASLEHRGVVSRTIVGCDAQGYYRPRDVAAAIGKQTRLVVLTHASNVLGTIQPIEEIGAICRERDVLFLVDAAQTIGSHRIALSESTIDLLAAPGHKGLLGPTGTGILYVGPRAQPSPWREGGTGGDSMNPLQPSELPTRLEAGTPNVVGLAGLAAGIESLMELGWDQMGDRIGRNGERLRRLLREIPGIHLLAQSSEQASRPTTATVSFVADWLPAEELAAVLDDQFDVAVRAGLHCAPQAHQVMAWLSRASRTAASPPLGAVRASAGIATTEDELERFSRAMHELAHAFSAAS